MKKIYKQLIILVLILILLVGGIFLIAKHQNKPDALDAFASCLKDKGATFYGAFWCPHCQNQKAMFGRSARLLPYQECSNPDGQSQNAMCNDKGIESYPTWQFADGSRLTGEIPLETLAEKTGCTLPATSTAQ
jgi:hypothetical protein